VPLADSGIYLRGCPQVQIWDHTNPAEFKNGAQKGSGGLWNNSAGAPGKDAPAAHAQIPAGDGFGTTAALFGLAVIHRRESSSARA